MLLSKPFARRRLVLVVALALAAVVLAMPALTRVASARLHGGIVTALGPRASLQSIELSWRGVELRGLRIAAARGWPAADELRAAQVRIVPDLRSLWTAAFGGTWRVARIDVEGGYLSLHRTRDGALRVVPALFGGQPGSAPPPLVVVSRVRLAAAQLDFFDSSVRTAAGVVHCLRLDPLDAEIGPLHLPALDAPVEINIAAQLRGPRHDGRLALRGTLVPATREATLDVRASGVDLVALQPYLLRVNEGGVQRGRLDLKLQAQVRNMRLHAPGSVTLTDLELSRGGGVLGTLAGAPRQAVLAAMRRDGRIEIAFTLEGRLDDPDFSVNDSVAKRIASGLAESLGVSVGGVVEGIGGVIKGLLGR